MLVPGVCAWRGFDHLEPTAQHHQAPRPPTHWGHSCGRKLFRLLPPVPGLYLCQTHSACTCNELVSAHNRVLGATVLPTTSGMRSVRDELRVLRRTIGVVTPETLDQALAHFKGARFTLYSNAKESLRSRPLSRRDANLGCFIKSEKFNPDEKTNPDPRMIQARGPRFNLHMAQYMHPLERAVYRVVDRHGLRIFAKGLNATAKADLILKKFEVLSNPVCFSLDASRFDKHVSPMLLKEEHRFYKEVFQGDALLAQLCNWQSKNKCRTTSGVLYQATGGRMSGDMNTAIGNCILMYAMLMAVSKRLGVEPLVVDDGDDCLMFIEKWDEAKFEGNISKYFEEFGMNIKLENKAYHPEDVVFCQSKIVGNRMVRNWVKVLSHGTSGVKHWNDPKLVRPMMTSVGKCELACNPGVPILQSYAEALIRNGRGERQKRLDVDHGVMMRALHEVGSTEKILQAKAEPITIEARLAFERAFGISPLDQFLIESRLEQWEVTEVNSVPVAVELCSDWVAIRDASLVKLPDEPWW